MCVWKKEEGPDNGSGSSLGGKDAARLSTFAQAGTNLLSVSLISLAELFSALSLFLLFLTPFLLFLTPFLRPFSPEPSRRTLQYMAKGTSVLHLQTRTEARVAGGGIREREGLGGAWRSEMK